MDPSGDNARRSLRSWASADCKSTSGTAEGARCIDGSSKGSSLRCTIYTTTFAMYSYANLALIAELKLVYTCSDLNECFKRRRFSLTITPSATVAIMIARYMSLQSVLCSCRFSLSFFATTLFSDYDAKS